MYKDLIGKKLLILGGDPFSVDIVNTAKSLGVHTIVTDWYDTRKSPAKLIADEYWNISIEAYDELLHKIKENNIDGVITGFTDSYLLPYQHLCELSELPCYGTREQFECLIDKKKYKALCREFDVPTIEAYSPESEDIKFPVLVKPVDGSGSRGITICSNKEQMADAIVKARNMSKSGDVLIEHYMDGREVTVFWLFVDGQYYLTMIGNRHVKPFGDGIIPLPVGYTFPSIDTLKYHADVENNAKRMFSHIGIRNGMMFMQCKVEDGTCYVYDIGYRLTGSLEYKILEKVCGFNPLKMMISFALTGKMTNEDISDKVDPIGMSPAFNVSCLCKPGTIGLIEGIEELDRHPNVLGTLISHRPGDVISEQMRGLLAQITVRVLGYVQNKKDFLPTMNMVEDMVRVTSVEGDDLRMPGIEPSDIEGYVI